MSDWPIFTAHGKGPVVVNPKLVQTIAQYGKTEHTVIGLSSGTGLVVAESFDEVVEAINPPRRYPHYV